ncbi:MULTISPECIES: hypothetical protein [Methylocaldum]|uniref:hypothetical protein n=1 Tax=Methylocaldum sp. GT1BB TaxID=3438963 RepID=UPI003DA0D2A6
MLQPPEATSDFLRNYRDMRDANTIGGDKYFHCKANCEATRRGKYGEATACTISDTREWFDQNIKGDPASASAADQIANTAGRSGGNSSPLSCDLVCSPFRPNGLPANY